MRLYQTPSVYQWLRGSRRGDRAYLEKGSRQVADDESNSEGSVAALEQRDGIEENQVARNHQ